MSVLTEVQESIKGVRGKLEQAVVGVGNHRGIGSGVVIADGKILTNAHNLRGDEVAVTFHDGRSESASVVGVDVDGDIAVLSADTKGIAPVEWNGAAAEIGDPVFALSNPGGHGLRVTVGYISGTQRSFRGPRGRRIAGSVEHTAPLLPGSSGGPTVDPDGKLLGINTNRLGEGFYLAIPADQTLRARVDKLSRGETPSRPRLGVGIVPPEVARNLRRSVGLPDADGLLVRFVEDDSAAAAAGIEQGDLITAAGGKALTNADELHDALEQAGTTLELTVLRGTEQRTVTVTLS
ncbi:MAG: serine protease [Actinobacteria bacterium]|nr:MAG: serine protease [Actinomycetota bacterium]